MKTVVVGSTGRSAGKTSLIAGMAKASSKSFGYMKPMGDRLLYRKKRLWDHDCALMTNMFGLSENLEDMTIGFEHSKLMYMYDEDTTRERLSAMVSTAQQGKELVFIEGGRDLAYGTSVFLDTMSVARAVGGDIVVVASDEGNASLDAIAFLQKYVSMTDVSLRGVIVNKIQNLEDYKETNVPELSRRGIDVLGLVPHEVEMTQLSVGQIAGRLLTKTIAGEQGLTRKARNILVAAMSTNAAIRSPLFQREDKLIIVGGDRSDLIVAALQSSTAGIVLTNNIVPSPNIVSQASEQNIPLLLVPFDTYETARQLDNVEPLLTADDTDKLDLCARLVREHVDLDRSLASEAGHDSRP